MTEWLAAGGVGMIVLAFSHWLAYELGKATAERKHATDWGKDAEELARQRAKPTPTDQAARDEAARQLRDRGFQRSLFDDS